MPNPSYLVNKMSGLVTDLLKHNHKKSAAWSLKEQDNQGNTVNAMKQDLKPQPPKSIAAIRDDDWKSLQTSITYLFHKKKLQKLELDVLNEKVRNVRDSKIGLFIVEYYKDSILKKGE